MILPKTLLQWCTNLGKPYLGFMICKEFADSRLAARLAANPPFIQLIVSDSIDTWHENLFGLINIHMDAKNRRKLRIYLNHAHPHYGPLEIKSIEYALIFRNYDDDEPSFRKKECLAEDLVADVSRKSKPN